MIDTKKFVRLRPLAAKSYWGNMKLKSKVCAFEIE